MERRETLGHLRFINRNMIYYITSELQTYQLLKIIFYIERKLKSGAISGWTGEDQLQIWSSHSSSTNNHLHYQLVYNGNANNVNTVQYVTQDMLM